MPSFEGFDFGQSSISHLKPKRFGLSSWSGVCERMEEVRCGCCALKLRGWWGERAAAAFGATGSPRAARGDGDRSASTFNTPFVNSVSSEEFQVHHVTKEEWQSLTRSASCAHTASLCVLVPGVSKETPCPGAASAKRRDAAPSAHTLSSGEPPHMMAARGVPAAFCLFFSRVPISPGSPGCVPKQQRCGAH